MVNPEQNDPAILAKQSQFHRVVALLLGGVVGAHPEMLRTKGPRNTTDGLNKPLESKPPVEQQAQHLVA